MLRFDDPLPRRPRRVLIAGVSGVGKTTLAERVARALGAARTEIDGLYHGPDWTPRPEFLDDVRRLVAEPSWVTEWQYADARPILADGADLLVWLDLPFLTVTLPRVVGRTVRRRLRRDVLWNGNIEPPLRGFFTDPQHIVRWSIATRRTYDGRIAELARARRDLDVVRLRSRREVEGWLAGPLARAAA